MDSRMKSGHYSMTWDAKDSDGRNLPSSICTARLLVPPSAGVTPEYAKSIKLVLLR